MSTIQELSSVDSPSGSDLVPIYSQANGDARKVSLTNLATFLQGQISANRGYQTQYASPNATAFTVLVAPTVSGTNVWLLLTPIAGYAGGTVTLPAVATCLDGQEVLVSCTQSVTTLTTSGNGATAVNGAPTTLAANAFFRLRFDGVGKSWYRIG